jgi:tRNA dimethylallyltransferase
MKDQVLIVLGPTAAGKTRLALEIAKKQGASVISADSRQVYAGMNIGTAKPEEIWRAEPHDFERSEKIEGVPHYLLNICRPNEAYSLADWKQQTEKLLKTLKQRSQPVIIAGGTMLYIESLLKNYQLPEVSANEELRRKLVAKPAAELYDELMRQDPAAAEFIEHHHQQRIIRALEVIQATGQKFSEVRRARSPLYNLRMVGIFPGWDKLEENISQRAQEMIDAGLVAETQQLEERYGQDLPLLKTINYAQAQKLLRGEYSEQEMKENIIRATTRYAKRQRRWWQRNKDIEWFVNLEDAWLALRG